MITYIIYYCITIFVIYGFFSHFNYLQKEPEKKLGEFSIIGLSILWPIVVLILIGYVIGQLLTNEHN